VLLLRLFEYSHWHHFAGLAVALALLGLGAAGTVLALLGPRPVVLGDGWLLAATLSACGGIVLVVVVQSRVALRPLLAGWDVSELSRLLLVDSVAFLPFLGAGLAIGHAFLRWPRHPRRVYAANLLGAGAGSAMASLALLVCHVETALAATAVMLALVALGLASLRRCRRWMLPATAALVVALALLAAPLPTAVSDFKPLARVLDLPGARVLAVEPGLRGRLTVVRADGLRAAPGLSLRWPSAAPGVDAAVVGSERVVVLPRAWPGPGAHLAASLEGLAPGLRPDAEVLALGAGAWGPTGRHGAARLTWVVPDGRILELARARGAGGPRFRGIADGFWHHLATSAQRYDVIAVDGAFDGGDAASEEYLLTAEGLSLALSRLRPGGLLAVPMRLAYPPRHFPRLLATLRVALLREAAVQPGDHVAVLRGLRALLVLASPQALSPGDLAAIRAFADRWGFDLAWLPGIEADEANRHHVLDTPAVLEVSRAVLAGGVTPPVAARFAAGAASVDRPYVWRSMRWAQVPVFLREMGLRGWSYLDWTLLLSVATAVTVTVLAFVMILVPLGRLPPAPGGLGRVSVVGYFAAVGIGYMLLEMAVFQRAILFLGEPVLAASTIFAAFLIGSGIGSACAPRAPGPGVVVRLFVSVAVAAVVAGLGLWGAPATLAALPAPLRVACVLVLVAPLAWALGRPFPWALGRLAGAGRWIPWAWGVNGFASVLAASAATLLSVQAGQPATLLAGLACYALAAFVALHWCGGAAPWRRLGR
jgi:hypothetical protein